VQVDKHIRRLDTDLARFEADLKEKQIESSDYDSSSSKGKKSEEGGGAFRGRPRLKGKRSWLFTYEGKREGRGLNPSFCLLPPGFPPLPQKAGLKRRRKLPVPVPKGRTQTKKPPRLLRRS
jgi:hypothetical protein